MAPIEGVTKFSIPYHEWTTQAFIQSIRIWPVLPIVVARPGEQIYLAKLRKFYRLHSLWLEYSLIEMNASKREKLRVELQINNYGIGKADADFSIAIRELCRQVYGKSEFFTNAASFEHLWFLVEYSNCRQRMMHPGLLTGIPTTVKAGTVLSADDVINSNQSSIRIYEQALGNNYLETEELPSNEDWLEHFLNILIAQSVKTAIDNKDKDLKRHCMQFLHAFRTYNANLEYSDAPLWLLINGKIIKSLPGAKSIKLPFAKVPKSRGRPIGSQNKKKRICKEM